MELPYTDDWKDWLRTLQQLPVDGFCLWPIQHGVNLTWNVFQPNTTDWVIVSNPAFQEFHRPIVRESFNESVEPDAQIAEVQLNKSEETQ